MPDDDATGPDVETSPGGATASGSTPSDPEPARGGGFLGRFGRSAKDTDHTTDEQSDTKRRTPLWLETVVLLGVALGMALLIKTLLVQAFYIPSASMEPGLVVNDRILVQKVSYWFGNEPSRGDVVVFEDPGNWLTGPEPGPQTILAKGLAKIGLYPTGGHLVKRVIGTPGDTIVCCDADGKLEINGVSIDEDDFIRPQDQCDGPMPNRCREDWSVTVPEDRLFVMGDNRAASADSSDRLCGPNRPNCDADRAFVPIDLVVGKVFTLVWPPGRAELIGRPDVFETVPEAG